MMDFTQVILGFIALVSTIITTVAVPYIRSRTTAAQQEQINYWVSMAVSAAEQVYTGSGKGMQKKAHVISFLREKGIAVDASALDAMIEAAVYKLKNGIIAVEV